MTVDSSNSNNKKICIDCDEYKKIRGRGMCNNCYYRQRKLKLHLESPLIECADGCGQLLHSIGLGGQPVKFIEGHGFRGKLNYNWDGGRHKRKDGYIVLQINGKRFMEHRVIMSQFLNRPLESWEIIHHKNEIKDDNRIENLKIVTRKTHASEHIIDMSDRICLLCGIKYEERKESIKRCWSVFGDGYMCSYCYYNNIGRFRRIRSNKNLKKPLAIT